MSLMLGDMAVTEVVKTLNEASLPDFAGRAYKYERPMGTMGEYIVVNHLPFVHNNVLENGVVNVNIHVPAMLQNLPDTKRLAELAVAVAELFPENTYISGFFYEFYADSRPILDDDKTYYVNLQIKVTFNNLNS